MINIRGLQCRKDHTYNVAALNEAIKYTPLNLLMVSLIAIILWSTFHSLEGNESLWIFLCAIVLISLLWSIHIVYYKGSAKGENASKYIIPVYVSIVCILSCIVSVFLSTCFLSVPQNSRIIIMAIFISIAICGAAQTAAFSPVMLGWIIPFIVNNYFTMMFVVEQWSISWAWLFFILYVMLLIECYIIEDAFYRQYTSRKKIQDQNDIIQSLYINEKQYSATISLYKYIIEQIPMAVEVVNSDGIIEYTNPYFSKLTGYKEEEVQGKRFDVFFENHSSKDVYYDIQKKINERNSWHGEYLNYKKNNETYEEESQIYPIFNEKNEVTYFVSISEDITDRKEEKQALKNALLQAEEANVAKSQFLANMSHEIRTPMNAILGMAYLSLQTQLDEKQEGYVRKIYAAAQSLMDIINDILNFSKIEADRLELEHSEFNLDHCVSDAIGIATYVGYEKGLEFLYQVEEGIPRVVIGDSLRLKQIITNLVGNAVKFTSQGTISIHVKELNRSHGKVKLQFIVSDTGIGISKEDMTKLFDAFSQVDNSTSRIYGGTGLGLAICKKLVAMMEGDIWVESKLNEGSQFIFTVMFHLHEEEREPFITMKQEEMNKKILVVDDNFDAREILAGYLHSLHCHVVEVDCIEAAIDAMKVAGDEAFDIALIDWKLHYKSDIDLVKKITIEKELKVIPKVIMVTAYDEDDLRKQLDGVIVHDILVRPISQTMLFDRIVSKLDKKQAYENEQAMNVNKSDYKHRMLSAEGRLKGSRILLVEDNEINRMIATELLEQKGAMVDSAINGMEAVSKIQGMSENHPYQLVLMDLQMPGMDGFEATKQIRSYVKNIPIIAMTARALPKEREECFAVGMNDHVSKPIDPQVFYITLDRWLSKQNIQSKSTLTVDTQDVILEIGGINTEKALKRLAGNVELYKTLLKKYNISQAELLEAMKKNQLNKDYVSLKKNAHTLKGVSANMGVDSIQKLSGKLEKMLEDEIIPDKIQFQILSLEYLGNSIGENIEEFLRTKE